MPTVPTEGTLSLGVYLGFLGSNINIFICTTKIILVRATSIIFIKTTRGDLIQTARFRDIRTARSAHNIATSFASLHSLAIFNNLN